MRQVFLLLAAGAVFPALAQNVGIGTVTPQTPLHVLVANATATVRVETSGSGTLSAIELKTSSTAFDQLELYKYRTGASGTMAGIPLSGLSSLTTGAGAQGGLLLGTIGSYPLHFSTNNTEQMRILANGRIGMGTVTPDYKLHLLTNSGEAGLGIQNNLANGQSLLTLGYGNRGNGNGLSLIKFGSGATGNAFGLSSANLSVITSDAGSSSLLIGTGNSSSLYLGTNSQVRMQINESGNAAIGTEALSLYRLHVKRYVNQHVFPFLATGAVLGENGSDTEGTGVAGTTFSPRSGDAFQTGVTGINYGINSDRYGVIGHSLGSTLWSSNPVFSAGVGGFGQYGVLGESLDNHGAGVIARHKEGKTALEVSNGFLKVSGLYRSAFKHTTASGNIVANYTYLTYAHQSAEDILLVTHNYSPYATYLNKAYGVFWDAGTSRWAIFLEDTTPMPPNRTFNVMVIKQGF